MWTHCIVIAPPRSQGFLGVFGRFEDWAFRHSARGRALNDSMCALSVGIPGAAEVEPHIFSIGPRIQGTRSELRPVVGLDYAGLPMRPRQPVEHVHNVVRGERSACLDRQRLARLLVDHGQHA